ncbi:MAG: metallophosphoesterase [Elusimicrobiota bacterium]
MKTAKYKIPGMKIIIAILLVCHIMSSVHVFSSDNDPCSLDKYPMRFAVIGDRTGARVPGVYSQIIGEIQRLQPDFIITVGDMIEADAKSVKDIKSSWKAYRKIMKQLTMPVYYTPGNHDIISEKSEKTLELYMEYIGEPYYSFDRRNIHFIMLDNSRYSTIDSFPYKQRLWLMEDLERNKDSAYTIVFMHRPYWINTVAGGLDDKLHDIFVKYGVDAVFTGDYHNYFSGEYDNIIYTGVGSSGGGYTTGPTGMDYHFIWVTVTDDKISIAPVETGAVRSWNEVTADEYRLVNRIRKEALQIEKILVGNNLNVLGDRLEARIKNLNKKIPLKGDLVWDLPPGWKVEPQKMHVDMKPGEDKTAVYTIKCTGDIIPAPVLSVDYPYSEEKKTLIKKEIVISRQAYADRAVGQPIIDGVLDDYVWTGPVTEFFYTGNPLQTTESVEFYFSWDPDNLYIAAKCSEGDKDSIVTGINDHDGKVYEDDCVGYLIQPNTAGPIYQIYINSKGVVYDKQYIMKDGTLYESKDEWDCKLEVETSINDGYWAVECRIPVNELRTTISPGRVWQVNFRRKQNDPESSSDWISPVVIDPKRFGALIFRK